MLSGKKKKIIIIIYAQYMPKLPTAELLNQPTTSVSNMGRGKKTKKKHYMTKYTLPFLTNHNYSKEIHI